MVMKREDHEALLTELMDEGIETSRKTEILQELRASNDEGIQTVEDLTKNNEKLQTDKDDLVVSNSKLFRQLGQETNPNQEEQEQQNLSEEITIESLEG